MCYKKKKANKFEKEDKEKITLKTSRPYLRIGKKGKMIQEITDVLQEQFGLEIAQIEVEEFQNPDINAQIMAERLAYSLDRGRNYRRAGYYIIQKVMETGAQEVEIIILFKIDIQKGRTFIFSASKISINNHPTEEVLDKGAARCEKNSEVFGVIVKIKSKDSKIDAEIKKEKTQVEYEVIENQGVLSDEDKKLLQI